MAVSGCVENACAAVQLSQWVGVVGGDSEPCSEGTVLTTHTSSRCSVKCGAGYSGAALIVTCASGAAQGAAATGSPSCDENSCAAYAFGVGVTGGDSDGCTDGVRLSTVSHTSCSVKCADGYGAAGSASVTCAADATDGAPLPAA